MRKRRFIFAAAALAIAALLAMVAVRRREPNTPRAQNNTAGRSIPKVSVVPAERLPIETESKSKAADSALDRLNDIAAQLAAAHNRDASRRLLAELRAFLDALPRETASRDVQSCLATGSDAATQLEVTVKPGGVLGDASSLRVFLLDYLGQIDRPAAGALARQILSAPTSPDEWAVSLRNVAWSDDSPATTEYLRGKAAELLATSAWRHNPSAGYLEAFDVVVHTRATELTPQLAELIREKENKAVAHAAYLTLDRLTITEPTATLQRLADQHELMSGREQTRANYFARADVRDPQQRALLERYLLDPRRPAQELQTFAGIYPNANFMISNNLLTPTPTPAHHQLAEHDREALATVDQWLVDPRFLELTPHLKTMHHRLQSFVKQATNSPGH